ncbi:hypothetical protein L484_026589 [Morus notabilis]|uniref:Pentacotripeptide-repeat region of PRORP domain-containing protein n=1 Tax=Morus notabilis TaxID=981085 RepID=W9SMS2_9ROSA|nr:pentatricopeptide repeat-containing protein At2g17670 [Morus notabilis]EXC35267.1 hypothetical protein L484_026589 [Morus notabilis]
MKKMKMGKFPKPASIPQPKTPSSLIPSQKPSKTPLIPSSKFNFKSPDLSAAKSLFNSISSTVNPDLNHTNSFLKSYASISTVDDSISLLRHMIKTHPAFSPDRSTYHILLTHSCAAPDPSLSPVHGVLNLMSSAGFSPDKVTADIAVRALCYAGKIDHAVQLFDEMSLRHSVPDSYTYNFLVKCLCKCRPLSTIYEFIDKTRSSFGLKPDLVTYTIIIDNVCNSKNLREITRLVAVLGEEGFKPDCFLYNTIMKGYCMLSRGSEAIEVYNKMKENGVEPDTVTYNTLIFGLAKSGRAKEARKYLKIMAEKGHSPDVVTYTSLMNGLCRERDVLGAYALLEEMKERGCEPNECTYNTLLHGFCKAKMVERGVELYRVMKERGMELDTAAYATLVRVFCRRGEVAEAYEVFDYAVESKSLTNVAAYSTLESALKEVNKAREQGRIA